MQPQVVVAKAGQAIAAGPSEPSAARFDAKKIVAVAIVAVVAIRVVTPAPVAVLPPIVVVRLTVWAHVLLLLVADVLPRRVVVAKQRAAADPRSAVADAASPSAARPSAARSVAAVNRVVAIAVAVVPPLPAVLPRLADVVNHSRCIPCSHLRTS